MYSWEIGYTEVAERCQTMNPRLKSSKKWTQFPVEYLQQIQGVFRENFNKELKGSELNIEGHIYPQEVLLRVAFGQAKSISRHNFIVSLDYDLKNPDILEKIHLAIDAIGSLMTDFFANDEESSELPRQWQEFEFNKNALYFVYSTENADLEKAADVILGESEDSFYHDEEQASDDALEIADEDEDLSKLKH